MTPDDEPLRWVEDDSKALLARLARAGKADGPSARAMRAAPVAVAALLLSSAPIGAAAAEAGGAAGALAAKSALSPLLLLKWVAIGTLGGSSVMALAHAPELLREAPKTEVARRLPSKAPRVVATVQASSSPAASSLPEPVSEPPPDLPSARPTDVAREVALLDAARAALIAGDAAKSLQLLRTLERLPERALVPEATVLRVRALLAHGQSAEARRVADHFCASAPSAPQAGVLRSLLANSEIQPQRSPL